MIRIKGSERPGPPVICVDSACLCTIEPLQWLQLPQPGSRQGPLTGKRTSMRQQPQHYHFDSISFSFYINHMNSLISPSPISPLIPHHLSPSSMFPQSSGTASSSSQLRKLNCHFLRMPIRSHAGGNLLTDIGSLNQTNWDVAHRPESICGVNRGDIGVEGAEEDPEVTSQGFF